MSWSAIFLLIFIPTAFASQPDGGPVVEPAGFENHFKQGIKLYEAKSFDEATDHFQKALALEPENVSALCNLALSYFQKGELGWSIALFRKALFINPDFETASNGLNFVLGKLEIKEIPHRILYWEKVRTWLLMPVSLNVFLLLNAIFVFAFCWTLVSKIGQRRRAMSSEQVPPSFGAPFIIFIFGVFVFSTLSIAKTIDETTTRATIVTKKVEAFSLPDSSSVSLFELYEGLEVILKQIKDDWIQVNFPGGPTGWIKKDQLFITNLESK